MSEKRIFLVTIGALPDGDNERLVEAASAKAAMQYCVSVQRASAGDVARLMAAGVKVEQADG